MKLVYGYNYLNIKSVLAELKSNLFSHANLEAYKDI